MTGLNVTMFQMSNFEQCQVASVECVLFSFPTKFVVELNNWRCIKLVCRQNAMEFVHEFIKHI